MEIRLTLKDGPVKDFVKRGMFRHEKSARAFVLLTLEKQAGRQRRATRNKIGSL